MLQRLTRSLAAGALLLIATGSAPSRAVAGADPGQALVNLDLDSAPLVSALKILARQHQLNVVTAGDITGTVTLHMSDVPLDQAITAMVTAAGYSVTRSGDVVTVVPAGKEFPEQLVTRVFEFAYVSADYMATSLKTVLSPRGRVDVVSRDVRRVPTERQPPATALLVTDLPYVMPRIEELVAQLDRRIRQVTIEVRMVETTLDSGSDFGLEWPSRVVATVDGDGAAEAPFTLPLTGRPHWGTLSVGQLEWFLRFISTKTNSKLLSNPKVTTLDNEPARITVATTIPLQTLSRFSEGAAVQDIVTFQDKEVGIILEVTPRINEGNSLTLHVVPVVEDIIGYTGPASNQRPITSKRSIETQVRLTDGETVVLGGLLKDNEVVREHRVWLLGRIPLIGNLFKHTTRENNRTDLMILITPHIAG